MQEKWTKRTWPFHGISCLFKAIIIACHTAFFVLSSQCTLQSLALLCAFSINLCAMYWLTMRIRNVEKHVHDRLPYITVMHIVDGDIIAICAIRRPLSSKILLQPPLLFLGGFRLYWLELAIQIISMVYWSTDNYTGSNDSFLSLSGSPFLYTCN